MLGAQTTAGAVAIAILMASSFASGQDAHVRVLTYGTTVRGQFAEGDEEFPAGSYWDTYQLAGKAGDHVHVAVATRVAKVTLWIQGENLDVHQAVGGGKEPDDGASTIRGVAAVDAILPADGTYQVQLLSESGSGAYVLAIDTSAVVRDLRVWFEHPLPRIVSMGTAGVDIGLQTHAGHAGLWMSLTLGLSVGVQVHPRLGIDVHGVGQLGFVLLGTDNPPPDDEAGAVAARLLIGPRVRYGNKWHRANIGLTVGASRHIALTSDQPEFTAMETAGVGARLELGGRGEEGNHGAFTIDVRRHGDSGTYVFGINGAF